MDIYNIVNKKNDAKCNSFPFRSLSEIFEKMEKTSGAQNKLKYIFNARMKSFLENQSIYPLMRLVLPLNDTERGAYGLKQTSVAKLYTEALHLSKTAPDADMIIHWKDPSKGHSGSSASSHRGDFCSMLETILKPRVRSEPSDITVGEVNLLLDDLAAAKGAAKTVIIQDRIVNKFCPNEQKWLMRIVFQDMKIGLKHEQVFNYFSPNALQRYNACTNLRTVFDEEGGSITGIQLFSKYSPMLAKGFPKAALGQVSSAELAMQGRSFLMDVKLDGERMSCHIKKDPDTDRATVMFFTRNGSDYTSLYQPLTIAVANAVHKGFSCILDGEVCAYDDESSQRIAFGHNQTIARMEREHAESSSSSTTTSSSSENKLSKWMSYVMFDVLYLDDNGRGDALQLIKKHCVGNADQHKCGDITQLPLYVRRSILKDMFTSVENRVHMITSQTVTSTNTDERKKQLESYFNLHLDNGEEGLVIKDATSTYQLGSRKDSWVKMKPDYGDQTADLDLLIIGGYYGEGKSYRGKGVSSFLCACKSDAIDGSSNASYLSLCKVGTGFSFDELVNIRKLFKEHAVPNNPNRPSFPPNVVKFKAKKEDIPDLWINFSSSFSLVVQLKCAELTTSTNFAAGFTCRFPRIVCFRADKSPDDITTMAEVHDLFHNPRGANNLNLASQQLSPSVSSSCDLLDSLGGARPKATSSLTTATRQRATRKVITSPKAVSSQFAIDMSVQQHTTTMFQHCVFCVLESSDFQQSSSDTTSADRKVYTREELIKEIKRHAGVCLASPSLNSSDSEVMVIVGNKLSFQANNVIASGKCDVVHFSYILACVAAGSRIALKAFYYLGMSEVTKRTFKGKTDILGDSYTEELDVRELSLIMANVGAVLDDRLSINNNKVSGKRKTRAEVSEDTQKADMLLKESKERRVASDEWNLLNTLSWRELAMMLSESTDGNSLTPKSLHALWNPTVIMYVDALYEFGDPQDRSFYAPGAVSDASSASPLRYMVNRLLLHGATVAKHLHVGVTHIIVNDLSDCNRIAIIKARLRELRLMKGHCFEKRIVDAEYIQSCILLGRIVSPDEIEKEAAESNDIAAHNTSTNS